MTASPLSKTVDRPALRRSPTPAGVPPLLDRDARRTLQQQAAHGCAIELRMAYCAIEREIAAMSEHAGRATAANHLACPNDVVRRMQLGRVLRSVRGIGNPTMVAILNRASDKLDMPHPLSEFKRVGELTGRQRKAIARELTGAGQ